MNLVSRGLLVVLALACGLGSVAILSAAPTDAQRKELVTAANAIKKASELYTAGKFRESGESIKDAQARLEKLAESADKPLLAQIATLHKRLTKAHALLELEGIKLPELKDIDSLGKPAPKPGDAPATPATPDGVSFTKQVAPILVSRCGGCHVRQMRGDFSMANYNNLMKGSKAGKVVFAGDPAGSALVELIEGKSMPPNGSGIPDAELATLKKWITEGAKFDGPDAGADLNSLAGGARPTDMPMVQIVAATGKETSSFARDVAPAIAANCGGCHGMQNPRNNFRLLNFEQLVRSGDNGPVILPGKPADSLLIKKLKGTGPGARMPFQREPLSDAAIAKIEKWIEEGAKYDGGDPKLDVDTVAALYKAQAATHEELTADRAKLAESNWQLALPGSTPDRFESDNFLVLGNVGENTLANIGERAEAVAPRVKDLFKAPADQPIVKGRMTLYAFKLGYDYNELGKMVERRDIPQGSKGHFRYTIVDAYGAIVPPRSNEYSLDGLLVQQLAGVYVSAQGKAVPRWFAEGCGRVAAARFASDDARVRAWNDAVPQVIGSMGAPDDFLTGKLDQESTDIASYSFVAFLMKDSRRFSQLIDALRKGGDFNQAFVATYGGTPNQAAQGWARKPATPKSLKRGTAKS